jgi:hypothetical protein
MFVISCRLYLHNELKAVLFSMSHALGIFAAVINVLTVTMFIIMSYSNYKNRDECVKKQDDGGGVSNQVIFV